MAVAALAAAVMVVVVGFTIALLEAVVIIGPAQVLAIVHMSTIAFQAVVPTGLAVVSPIGQEMAALIGLAATATGRAMTTVQSRVATEITISVGTTQPMVTG